jgi:RHS repeat-associated protein
LYRKAANNSATGQTNPLAYTPIEDNQIEKNTNRFTSATGTTYNEAGMVVADNKFRSMGFSYDAKGRQVKAMKANTSDTFSVYDALGNRVATKVNDVWQFVIYDAFGKLVAEYGTQGEGNGGVNYVFQDRQGSVRASINYNGFVVARFDFTAFGEEVSLGVGLRSLEQGYTGDATTKQGYGLTEKDSSGQNHTWFRKNENRAGRWTSPDPYNGSMGVDNPQSFNRYSYVENQPTNFVDPSGLQIVTGWAYTCFYACTFWWDCEPRGCQMVYVTYDDGRGPGPKPPAEDPPSSGGGSVEVFPTFTNPSNPADCDKGKRKKEEAIKNRTACRQRYSDDAKQRIKERAEWAFWNIVTPGADDGIEAGTAYAATSAQAGKLLGTKVAAGIIGRVMLYNGIVYVSYTVGATIGEVAVLTNDQGKCDARHNPDSKEIKRLLANCSK